jgi:DNA polymerase elongation subunit (family B)
MASKKVIAKSFRLFYFDVLNETVEEESNSSDSDSGRPKQRTDNKQFLVQMYGINEKGETCSIIVDDFEPFFYIKVPDHWTAGDMNRLIGDIKRKLDKPGSNYYGASLLRWELVDSKKLYGFSAGKLSKFIKLTFKNTVVLGKVKNLWFSYHKVTGDRFVKPFEPGTLLYEANLPPLLRFFHINKIAPNGWVMISSKAPAAPLKTTSCTYEFIASQKHLKPLSEKETAVPYKIMSFDIEAGSSHGDFPLPKKTYKRLAINMMDAEVKDAYMFKRMVFTAFGYDSITGIDKVYTKSLKPVKAELEQRVKAILEQPFNELKSDLAEVAKLLTVKSMFSKMIESAKYNGGNDDDADADDEDANEIQFEIDEPEPEQFRQGPDTSLLKAGKTETIINIIVSDKYSRDEKVDFINEALTNMLPPLEGDPVTMIGSTFLNYGSQEPHYSNCIVLGECAPVEGAEIVSVPIINGDKVAAEQALLLAWADLVRREDPDIIIGYNIFGFDYEFLFRRAEETNCVNEFLMLSRRNNEFCGNRDRDDPTNISIENTKVALASGEYDLRYINMSGRLQVDLYSYFRRNFNLSSYKLDDVASQNISDDIKKIVDVSDSDASDPALGITNYCKLYTKNITGLHAGDFIHIELSSFTSDYYTLADGTYKFQVLSIDAEDGFKVLTIAGHHASNIDKTKKLRWGMAKDDVSPQDIFRMSDGPLATPESRAKVAKYCIQDCNLVHHLMRKIDVMTEYMEMANLCSVPINFLVFRGQGIKLTSYVAKKCMEKGYLMPDLEKAKADGGYEGAIVLPPKTKIYIDEPVACVDYASLYPSSMISQNYCHSSKVWAKEYDLNGKLIKQEGEKDAQGNYKYYNLPGYEYVEVEFDRFEYRRNPLKPAAIAQKTKVGKRIVCWAQLPNGEKSVMPSILMELLKAREDTKKKAKKAADPFMANILDKRQLAYKVTANSLYGQCGARTSTFYEKDVAASTTASGRMSITYARRIIEEIYANRVCKVKNANHSMVMTNAEYVYGDSVASYTPVYVKVNNTIHICTIDQLADKFGLSGWRTCLEPGKQTKEVCELAYGIETWTEKGWTHLQRVIRHALAPEKKMVRIITQSAIVDVTDDHSLINSNGTEVSPKELDIDDHLLHYSLKERASNIPNYKQFTYATHSQLDAAMFANHLYSEGYYAKITIVSKDRYQVNCCSIEPSCKIQDMYEIPYEGYVYDLTTENHHFAAGVGNMIVHNTDSVFFIFNLTDKDTGAKIVGKDALEITIELAQEAANYATMFLKPPMKLAYEKTLQPFALLSKKRYVGILYEEDPNKGKLKYMGLSLKRRDSCDYLKDTYGQIINIIMNNGSVPMALQHLDQCLTALIKGQVPTDKLAITKSLRSYYKNPQQIAHRVLADRIGQRDPGNMPKPGDRMKFLHFWNPDKNALQGDKIETPEYIAEAGLKLDYGFYVSNQLMKPLCQFLGLALEEMWKSQGKITAVKKHQSELASLQKEFPDFETFIKKKEKLCSDKAKTLFFDKYLVQIRNDQNGLRPITGFFGYKK